MVEGSLKNNIIPTNQFRTAGSLWKLESNPRPLDHETTALSTRPPFIRFYNTNPWAIKRPAKGGGGNKYRRFLHWMSFFQSFYSNIQCSKIIIQPSWLFPFNCCRLWPQNYGFRDFFSPSFPTDRFFSSPSIQWQLLDDYNLPVYFTVHPVLFRFEVVAQR